MRGPFSIPLSKLFLLPPSLPPSCPELEHVHVCENVAATRSALHARMPRSSGGLLVHHRAVRQGPDHGGGRLLPAAQQAAPHHALHCLQPDLPSARRAPGQSQHRAGVAASAARGSAVGSQLGPAGNSASTQVRPKHVSQPAARGKGPNM